MSHFLSDAASPSFSVVINTLNRADLLNDAIRGVMQLDYPQVELIVVNGPSSDNSGEVLGRWQGRIKHLHCDVANLSVSRNVGVAAAAGDIVAFLDDDAVPHPLWLRYLASNFADPAIGGVGGFTVDNTGVRWQVRKTVCDRFGNAYFPSESYDERGLIWPSTPVFPSLLGTNSSFRMDAMRQIGAFDHVFAYLLDETDVCLRLVDAGWKVVYEPSAIVFHQFAESHIRSSTRKPKTLYPSVVSKTYFITRHGHAEGYGSVSRALDAYRDELFRANAWLEDHGDISPRHRQALDHDVEEGTRVGTRAGHQAVIADKARGDLNSDGAPEPFLPLMRDEQMRVALVSQGWPPENEAGIARWTQLLAEGLRDQGVAVHIITRAKEVPSRRFRDGIWFHRIARDDDGAVDVAARYRVPVAGVSCWMAGVMREIAFLKTFGLDLVSFPIWDLEALPVMDDPDLACVLSLHTTYQLAKPFKPEWNSRVIYGRSFVEPMVAAERQALAKAPHILANSQAVIDDIEASYEVELQKRARIIPHGTPDILERLGVSLGEKNARQRQGGPLRVLFAGRFEPRKGYELALEVARKFLGNNRICFDFVGSVPCDEFRQRARGILGAELSAVAGLSIHGEVARTALERLYFGADVVLMPSRFESFGLVAIEAMSAATPVLALARGGLMEVVEDGVSGYLYTEESQYVERAAERLNHLLHDREALVKLASNSYRRFTERFSDVVMARKVAEFYRYILSQRGDVP